MPSASDVSHEGVNSWEKLGKIIAQRPPEPGDDGSIQSHQALASAGANDLGGKRSVTPVAADGEVTAAGAAEQHGLALRIGPWPAVGRPAMVTVRRRFDISM